MFCWGDAAHSQLGLPPGHDEQIFSPIENLWFKPCLNNKVIEIAGGESHTLFLTEDGKIYSCGNNDYNQLGHNLNTSRPQLITALEAYKMTKVSCGSTFSLAVNEWGQTFSWGALKSSNAIDTDRIVLIHQPTPKIIRSLATQHAVQISCGYNHFAVLTNTGDLYTWGANNYGQLGIGKMSEFETEPTLVNSLIGVPIALVVCGGNHTFALTKSGAVFGWGKNVCGQLGLNDIQNRCYPTHLRSLRSIKICNIACGEDFTAFLTLDGGIFTCGAGSHGQLGHGDMKDEMLPRKVMELMGSAIIQVACGRRHMIVVAKNGRVQTCGLGAMGQLGIAPPPVPPSAVPKVVRSPWQFSSDAGDEGRLWKVFAGGNSCFVLTKTHITNPHDCRYLDKSTQILSIDPQIVSTIEKLTENDPVDQDTLSYLETVFKSLSCLNGSFLTVNDSHYCCNSKNIGVDLVLTENVFNMISRIENLTLKEVILQSISTGVIPKISDNPPDAEALRYLLVLPMYHEMLNAKLMKCLQLPLANVITRLKTAPLKLFTAWCHDAPKECFERIVDIFKNIVYLHLKNLTTSNIFKLRNQELGIVQVLNAMTILYTINSSNPSPNKAPPDAFYIHDLGEIVDVRQDYIDWLSDPSDNIYLCHFPFLFDTLCKISLLEMDQAIQMHAAMNLAASRAFTSVLLQGRAHPTHQQFVTLNVSREFIVADTLRELANCETSDLKKPLKVKFHGEEAEDAGGVRKEFFMLLLREILDPKYGMFQHYPHTNCIWFAEDSFEEEDMYLLIGVIYGLAIYNFSIINVPFPLALYKKLLNVPVTLEDVGDLSPVMMNSLKSLLDYEGDDVDEVFGLNFEISREIFGEVRQHPLIENGSNIAVTKENKEEYVKLYVDFIFNKSIKQKFDAFCNGFYKVCGGRVFKLFQPHELMALVIGNEIYDWEALESSAEYKNGYHSGDPVIRAFWEVLHEFTEEDKKKFLLFLTGSDRIPIRGMKAIKITIQATNDDRFLPVAHTCFNLLDLPRYSTKEKLKYKLLQAMQQTEGFSLV